MAVARRLRKVLVHCTRGGGDTCSADCAVTSQARDITNGLESSAPPRIPGQFSYSWLYPSLQYRQKPVGGLLRIDIRAAIQFQRDGFLVCRRAFSRAMVEEALNAIDELVAGRNTSFEQALSGGTNFDNRVRSSSTGRRASVLYESRQPERQLESNMEKGMEVELIRKLNGFEGFDRRFEPITRSAALLTAVRRLLGKPRTSAAEVQLFQDMALLKMCGGSEKPWHQDNAYFVVGENEPIVGCWIALEQATPSNGCMRILPGGHRQRRPHFQRRDWQLCDDDVASFIGDAVAVPLEPGDCLFFSGLLPHGTPANSGATSRKSMQLHFAWSDAVAERNSTRLRLFDGSLRKLKC